MIQKIAFVGMTHLGLNYLAASSVKKKYVTGFDSNIKLIKDLKMNNLNLEEPHLKNILKKNRNLINFSSNFEDLRKFKLIFISQDVETNVNNVANLKKLKSLINKSIKYIKKNSTLVILSQIQPGLTRSINFNKKNLFYQVETLVFGKAISRALYPERIIIGCDNKKIKINKEYLNFVKSFNSPIVKMSYESAEITKIAINTFLASSITTTNVLTDICSSVDADWEEILPALRLDKRIGKYAYLKSGLGISGGNIERDIVFLNEKLKGVSTPRKYISSIIENSKFMKSWVYRTLNKNKLLKKKINKIGILGLSYKENTSSLKNSPAIELLNKIKRNKIAVFDPKAKLKSNMPNCVQEKNIKKVINHSDILIIMTPWKNFKNIENLINRLKKKIIIIDPYKMINQTLIKKSTSIRCFNLG